MAEVRFFAAAAEAAGRDAMETDLLTVGDLLADLENRFGDAMARVLRNGSFLVDGVVTRDPERALGARVDVLPPFSGG